MADINNDVLIRGAWEQFGDGFNEVFGQKDARAITVAEILNEIEMVYMMSDIVAVNAINDIINKTPLLKLTLEPREKPGKHLTRRELNQILFSWYIDKTGITKEELQKARELDDWFRETGTHGENAAKYLSRREANDPNQANKSLADKLNTHIPMGDVIETISYHFYTMENSDKLDKDNGKVFYEAIIKDILEQAKMTHEDYVEFQKRLIELAAERHKNKQN